MLHPQTHVRRCDVNELEGGGSRVKALLLEQVGLSSRPMEHGHHGLAVFNHISVQFHHLPFLARAQQQDGHPGGMRVPNLTPTCRCLGGELTDGHVGNHGGYTHGGTVGEETVPTFYPAGGGGCLHEVHGAGHFCKVDDASCSPSQGVV